MSPIYDCNNIDYMERGLNVSYSINNDDERESQFLARAAYERLNTLYGKVRIYSITNCVFSSSEIGDQNKTHNTPTGKMDKSNSRLCDCYCWPITKIPGTHRIFVFPSSFFLLLFKKRKNNRRNKFGVSKIITHRRCRGGSFCFSKKLH